MKSHKNLSIYIIVFDIDETWIWRKNSNRI